MLEVGSAEEDLFFTSTVRSYVEHPRFLKRDWLAAEVDGHLSRPNCRFVLLTAAPGAGKSTFIAQLAQDHSDWPRYFIRRDQRTALGDVSAQSLLLQIGFQLAALHPDAFKVENLKIIIKQRLSEATGPVTGADVDRILASPFHQQVLRIQQEVGFSGAAVTGLRVREWVVEPRLLSPSDLQYMALIDPARVLFEADSNRRLVILLDALDELRYHNTGETLMNWLTNVPLLPRNVRFVLTSRPPDGALLTFCEKQAPYISLLKIEPNDGRVQDDLKVYVNGVAARPDVASILANTEQGAANFIDQTVAKADGNLGYVDALVRGIDRAITLKHDPALQELLALQNLPDDIQGLYAFFLHQIKTAVNHQSIEVRDASTGERHFLLIWPSVYKRILGVLSVAREPLAVDQIGRLGAIAVDRDYVLEAIEWLHQFLEQIDNRFRLYHSTLAEFLGATRTRDSAENGDLYADPLEWNSQITAYYLAAETRWYTEFTNDRYLWGYLPQHLLAAKQTERISHLLCDYRWLNQKLLLYDVVAIIGDYDLVPSSPVLTTIKQALRLGQHVIARDSSQLAAQLIARLSDDPTLTSFLTQLKQASSSTHLTPLNRSLSSPRRGEVLTYRGHSDKVNAIAVTNDGKLMVSASSDCSVIVWELKTGYQLGRIRAAQSPVLDVAISDHGLIVAAYADNTLRIFDLDRRVEIGSLVGHSASVHVVAIASDDRVISGSGDGNLRLWNLRTFQCERVLAGHARPITDLALAGTRQAVSLDPSEMRVWDLVIGETVLAIPGEYGVLAEGECTRLGVTPDGEIAVVSLGHNGVMSLDLRTGRVLQNLYHVYQWINSFAMFKDGRHAVVGFANVSNEFGVLSFKDRLQVRTASQAHSSGVTTVALTADESGILTGSSDHTVKLWSTEYFTTTDAGSQSSDVDESGRHVGVVNSIVPIGDTEYFFSGAGDYSAMLWSARTGEVVRRFGVHSRFRAAPVGGITVVAATPDGRLLLAGSASGRVRTWHTDSGTELFTWDLSAEGSHSVQEVVISPLGKWAVAALENGDRLFILDLAVKEKWDDWSLGKCSIEGIGERYRRVSALAWVPKLNGIVFLSDTGEVGIGEISTQARFELTKIRIGKDRHVTARILRAGDDRALALINRSELWMVSFEHETPSVSRIFEMPDITSVACGSVACGAVPSHCAVGTAAGSLLWVDLRSGNCPELR